MSAGWRSRRVRFALVWIFALLAAGCGGSDDPFSKERYELEVLGIVRTLEPEANELFFDIVAHDYPRGDCAARSERFHEVLEEIVGRVEELRPPEEVADLHRRFLAAAHESVDEVGEAVAAVRRGRLSCGRQLNDRIYGLPSTGRAERVLDEYQERGYFRLFGGE